MVFELAQGNTLCYNAALTNMEGNVIKPMENKSQEIKDFIEEVFPGTAQAIEERKCPLCNKPITDFRDTLSEREYGISGMCQACQDSMFKESDHDT